MPSLTVEEDEIFDTNEWKQKMSAIGSALKNNNVRQTILVHGTFTGDDALGLYNSLEPINKALADSLREKSKNLIDNLTDDVGNYTSEYANALSFSSSVPCELFVWSGGNYHHARLRGLLKLAQYLVEKITNNKIQDDEKILLLGHSHAGQLFALLTTFLAEGEQSQTLYQILETLESFKGEKLELIKNLEIIKKIRSRFILFGSL